MFKCCKNVSFGSSKILKIFACFVVVANVWLFNSNDRLVLSIDNTKIRFCLSYLFSLKQVWVDTALMRS